MHPRRRAGNRDRSCLTGFAAMTSPSFPLPDLSGAHRGRKDAVVYLVITTPRNRGQDGLPASNRGRGKGVGINKLSDRRTACRDKYPTDRTMNSLYALSDTSSIY